MRWSWKLAASVVTVAALAVIAVAAATAANPHQKYTCTRETENGHEVQVDVPEPAVSGLTNAGFTCVPNAPDGGEDPGNEDPGNEDPATRIQATRSRERGSWGRGSRPCVGAWVELVRSRLGSTGSASGLLLDERSCVPRQR